MFKQNYNKKDILLRSRFTYFIVFIFLFKTGNLIAQEKDSLGRLVQKENGIGILDTVSKKDLSATSQKTKIDDIVSHTADDIVIISLKNKSIYLENKAQIKYKDITIDAGIITIDNNNRTLKAKGILIDSTKEYTQKPVFQEGKEKYTQDSMIYNLKTKEAVIYGMRTMHDELIILGEKSRKENENTIYVKDIRFTTSDKDDPDYYIGTSKAKIIPGERIILSDTYLYIANVWTPIFVPFGYFPTSNTSLSGFIIPTYGDNSTQGFFLQNGGYFFSLSEYLNLEILGDFYTNGSWGIRTSSQYIKLYKFSGNFNFRYENNIQGFPGYSNFSKALNYNLQWSHSQDRKMSPYSTFSASVNIGSSQYFRQSNNQVNISNVLSNTLSSSISYSRQFPETPFNMSASLTHSQNTNTEIINLTLPSLQLSMNRINPFKAENKTATNAFEKIGVTYNMSLDNRIQTTDTNFLTQEMFKDMKNGIRQSVSTNTNFNLFKYINVSPSINFSETSYLSSISKSWDTVKKIIVKDTINKFASFRTMDFGASFSTLIYGIFNMKIGRLRSIRHTLTPSVSYNYKPALNKSPKQVQNSDSTFIEYSPFEEGIYGSPSNKKSSSVSFSLNNTFEAKLKSIDTTKEEMDKIMLLNNLSFSSSYNFEADSLKMSPVSFSTGMNFFKNKLNLNLNGSLDPYSINASGVRINRFLIEKEGKLFRLTSANVSTSFSINSKDLKTKKENPKNSKNENKNKLKEGSRSTKKDITDYDAPFDSNIEWSLSGQINLGYQNHTNNSEINIGTLGFSGKIKPSKKWSMTISSGYDFQNKGLSLTQLSFSRDLDSWIMSFSWVPVGVNTSYFFNIGVKSSILSDLKWDKRSLPFRRL